MLYIRTSHISQLYANHGIISQLKTPSTTITKLFIKLLTIKHFNKITAKQTNNGKLYGFRMSLEYVQETNIYILG